ncbi:type II toxin-antitoxin system VapB family antitoxin [uncultured Demequina sp.]|uniref:type II toxin-antitoxin system VapB family antitoxin n=1 Tax=uncultured Demequina sp. TaxID=693499 RepID=UPI0025F9F8DD|nr:type II toxin-antitoxin system VapB family antitoxin [uncultured Demequina sp.]
MTLHIENEDTEKAVHDLALRLGVDDETAIRAAIHETLEALEEGTSYAQRRNARVRLRSLLDRAAPDVIASTG